MSIPVHLAYLLVWTAIVYNSVYSHAQTAGDPNTSAFTMDRRAVLPHNATSCSACHSIPSDAGSSRVVIDVSTRKVLNRVHETVNDKVLIPILGMHKDISRVALEAAGDGLVEAVPGQELQGIAADQMRMSAGQIHGTATVVIPPEGGAREKAIGRFGWKAQHASLTSASADALRNELGIPNRFFASSEDGSYSVNSSRSDDDVTAIVRFLRSVGPVLPSAEQGATEAAHTGLKLFDKIGCSICHVRTLTTAPAGAHLNGGTLLVSERLGSKKFHPFSDYLLHDVGTGDGVVQNIRPEDYDPSTANKFRTAPLWGVRFRSWLMHDGQSVTYHQAIMRHGGEATEVVKNYMRLTPVEKEQLRQFLGSL